MDGLEAVELSLSEITHENIALRVDSEYFKKAGIVADELVRSRKWAHLRELASRVQSFGAYSLCNQVVYLESGIPFLRCVNIKQGIVDFNEVLYINNEANKLLWKSAVKPGMVLLSMSGSVGNAAVALNNWTYPVNSNQDIAKITPANLNPYYLTAYFGSQTGQAQLLRHPVGSVQQHIFLWQIENLAIPLASPSFQNEIENQFKAAYERFDHSHSLYSAAEETLLKELSLIGWKPRDEQSTTRSVKDAASANRLDAEHFQTKYWAIRSKCISYPDGAEPLSELITSITNGVESREFVDQGVPYLRVGDMRMLRIDPQSPVLIPRLAAVALKSKIQLKAGDVLIARSGSIGQAAVVTPEHIDSILSSHLMRIRLKPNSRVQPVYFALFMATLPGVQQVLMHSNGGVVPEISQPNLKLVVVPLLKKKVQDRLAELIEESQKTENCASELLGRTWEAVNIAIKSDEKAALDFLKRVRN